MIPVEDLEVLVTEMHEHAEMEGEDLQEVDLKKLYDGVVGAGKAVGGVVKKVLEPADNSPEAQKARMGARRPQTDLQKDVARRTRDVMKNSADLFDIVKGHLISEHELSEDVAIQVMTLLDEETRREIMEYTASMGAGPRGTTVKMTADGKEPVGDRLLKGIGNKIGGFLNRLNPNALKSTTVEPRKPLVSTQKNSYELEGELVDEGSCGSKKKTSKKKRY